MPRPRVFISSTVWDLRYIREEVKELVESFGYDALLSEQDDFLYSHACTLEESCLTAVQSCDLVIWITGGRFGVESSRDSRYSISQQELIAAWAARKRVEIFVDERVMIEHDLYKCDSGLNLVYANDARVHDFICKIENRDGNNAIHRFKSLKDIKSTLCKQWAELMRDFISGQYGTRGTAEVFGVEAIYEHLSDLKALEEISREDEIVVLKSWYLDNDPFRERFYEMIDVCDANIHPARSVQILVCHPNSEILKVRSKSAKEMPNFGGDQMRTSLPELFKRMKKRNARQFGKVSSDEKTRDSIGFFNEWPSSPIILYGDWALVGYYFKGDSSPNWPWIKVRRNSPFGRVLFDQIEKFRKISTVFDVSASEKKLEKYLCSLPESVPNC